MIRDQFFQQADPPSHNLLAGRHGTTKNPLRDLKPIIPARPAALIQALHGVAKEAQ